MKDYSRIRGTEHIYKEEMLQSDSFAVLLVTIVTIKRFIFKSSDFFGINLYLFSCKEHHLTATFSLGTDSFKYKKSFNNHFGNTSLNFNKNDTTADEDDKIVKYCSGRQKPKSL